MNYLPVILGDLLLSIMVYYAVSRGISRLGRRRRQLSPGRPLFPK